MHDNLDTFFKALNAGAQPSPALFGFLHSEPKGILAIDQKGGGAGLKQTRLYVFPNTKTETIHLITIGDKRSQSEDIAHASRFVDVLRTSEDVRG